MKWWLVLVAFALGLVVTWLMTRRREGEPVSGSERAVSADERTNVDERLGASSTAAVADESRGEVDDASAFGGSPSEFSSAPGAAESWHRDAQDEDALLSHEPEPEPESESEPEPEATRADVEASVPPVAEATPNGDVAGVGQPQAVQAVDAVEVDADAVKSQPAVSQPARESEQGTFTFDEDPGERGEGPGEPPVQRA
jgi:hypothetical protein